MEGPGGLGLSALPLVWRGRRVGGRWELPLGPRASGRVRRPLSGPEEGQAPEKASVCLQPGERQRFQGLVPKREAGGRRRASLPASWLSLLEEDPQVLAGRAPGVGIGVGVGQAALEWGQAGQWAGSQPELCGRRLEVSGGRHGGLDLVPSVTRKPAPAGCDPADPLGHPGR